MPLLAGTRMGPYEVLAPLGGGGMGEVYRGRDPRLHRDVALQLLPALSHPNLLAVYDLGDGFVVSALVEGATLRGVTLGLRKTLDLTAKIASGLAAAHAAGIVHRDLKPDNVLLTSDGRAKILDVGLARVMRPPSAPPDATTPPPSLRQGS